MRQGPNTRRSRGRGNNNGGRRQNNVPLRHQTFDSNGPDVRIRGNAFQVHEKYLALARDAQTSGDRVAAENYFQHAEHYFRIIAMINEQESQRSNREGRGAAGNGAGNGHAGHNGSAHEHEADGDDGEDSDAEEERPVLNA